MAEPGSGAALGIDSWVRELLRCPACRSRLTDGERELRCTASECARVYPIDELGIPDLVLDEADDLDR